MDDASPSLYLSLSPSKRVDEDSRRERERERVDRIDTMHTIRNAAKTTNFYFPTIEREGGSKNGEERYLC